MTAVVLDGRPVSVRAGCTVLEACREHGVAVPTLCHLDGVSEAASCRVCLVEVKGFPRPVSACSTRVVEGMELATSTATLARSRRAAVELLLARGGHVCAFCPASGRCELQALARALGVDHRELVAARAAPALDASRPRFALDPGRCVLCTRCVRVCAELEGAGTLHLVGRGARTRVATDGGAWGASATCTDCGRCVAACPTGALLEKSSAAQGLATALRRDAPADPPPPEARSAADTGKPRRARVATVALGGCSGCHMSLLDLDEALLDLAPRIDLVSSPLAEVREDAAAIDVCLVEGAISTGADLAAARRLRAHSRVLVALGDCAASGNVTGLRDGVGGAAAIRRAAGIGERPRDPALPALLDPVLPLGAVVAVDVFLPGCPPPAADLGRALGALVAAAAGAR